MASTTDVTSSVSAPVVQNPPTAASQTTMNKDSFLKLLVAQISHQDPLKPMEGTEFVTQLSQFAMVEQTINQSGKLDTISAQLTGVNSSGATGLVGKTVTIGGGGMAFDGTASVDNTVTLSGPAKKVIATITDGDGKTIRKIDLGSKGTGPVKVTWDGKDDTGVPQPAGNYKMKVSAEDDAGKAVDVSQSVSGIVSAISFDKGYPEITLDSGATAPVSNIISVKQTPTTSSNTTTDGK